MGLYGKTRDRLTFEKAAAATTYERNRLISVVKSTGKASYSTYGSVADGCTTYVPVGAHDERVAIYPLSSCGETVFLKALAAITKGNYVFPATDGKIVQSSYNVLRGVTAVPAGTEDEVYLLPHVPTGTGWENHPDGLAIKGASTYSYVDVSATANLGLTVYVADERRYYTWNGTAWVVAKAAAIAMENAVAGQEIVCYNLGNMQRDLVDNLPANVNYGPMLVKAVGNAAGNATVTFLDNRVLTTDRLMITIASTTNACYLRSCICSVAGTVTLVFSADPGAWTGVLAVYRD